MEIIKAIFEMLKAGLDSERMTIPIIDLTLWQFLIGVFVLKVVIDLFRFLLSMPGQQLTETKQPIQRVERK